MVETVFIKIQEQEGILYCVYASNLEIDLEIAKSCVKARMDISNGRSYPCLVDMKGIKSATKEAREYFANEGAELIKACALIIGSPLTKMLGNVFLLINKPAVPVKLFTDEKEAKQWLKQYL